MKYHYLFLVNPAETYILDQQEPFKSILLHVSAVVERHVPHVELKFKWRIPCYYVGKSPICYLNVPASKKYVDVGFWHSAHLTKHLDQLVSENRKVVKSLRYSSLEELDERVLIDVLLEAYETREKGFYNRK